jgi:hypothetical protein
MFLEAIDNKDLELKKLILDSCDLNNFEFN